MMNASSAAQQAACEETLNLPLEIKAAEGEGAAPGTFEGYGAVFGNQDRDGDVVERGAFVDSLKAGVPALLWQHDQKQPIGRFDLVREDKRGLFVKGRLSQTGKGAEAYELLKMGALNGLSIGFVTKEASRDTASGTRRILRANLMEVSLVTFPANELARVEAVKSQMKETGPMENTEFDGEPGDVRTFERMLRDKGFSRSRAKAITAKGFRAADIEADESAEIAEMVETLQHGQLALKAKLPLNRFFERLVGTTNIRSQSIRLFPGKSGTVRVLGVKLGEVTFKVMAPSFADWECDVEYYNFSSGRPVRKQETLYLRKGASRESFTVNRGKPPRFNPLKIDDWRKQFPEQLVLDSTKVTFRYLKFDDPTIDDLPQRAVRFSISARS